MSPSTPSVANAGLAPTPRLAMRGLLALPGRVGAMCVAPTTGALAAGDDRGEAGIWNGDGSRRASFRLASPIVWADVWGEAYLNAGASGEAPGDGSARSGAFASGVRAAFVDAAGDGLVSLPGGSTIRLRVKPGQRVLIDRAGPGFFVVDAQRGDVQVHDGTGRPLRRFPVPGPIESAVCIARTGGIATVSKQGVAGRFAAWGALLWGGDYRRYAAGLASDPQGERIIVCFLSFGAEVLHASSGARVGVLDVGRPVECAAASSSHIALGCSDGSIVLTDHSGRIVGEGRAASKVVGIGIGPGTGADTHIFVRLGDGTVRLVEYESASPRASDATPTGAQRAAAPATPAAPTVVARRKLATSGGATARVLVAVAADGSRVVTGEARERTTILNAQGRVEMEASHAGALLDAWVHPTGDVWLATTREIRCLRAHGGDRLVASEPMRAFAAELVRATWSSDGAALVVSDELGTLRIMDRATGADIASASPARGDRLEFFGGSEVAAAYQTRSGAIACFGAGWERAVQLAAVQSPAVQSQSAKSPAAKSQTDVALVAVTRSGPLVRSATDLIAVGWDGHPRWTVKLRSRPSAVRVLPDERILVALADGVVVVERDGRASRAVRRPEGTLACVSGTGSAGVSLAWRDGRRLAVSDLSGATVLEETFESPVISVAAADSGGLIAVSIEGSLLLVRGPSRQTIVDPSHDRASSAAIG